MKTDDRNQTHYLNYSFLYRSPESYSAYLETMPWLSVPFQQTAVRGELAQLYGVRGIPTLLLLDNNGHIITTDARTEIAEDPSAQYFPWKPRPVNILTERYLTKLYDYPAIILFVGEYPLINNN